MRPRRSPQLGPEATPATPRLGTLCSSPEECVRGPAPWKGALFLRGTFFSVPRGFAALASRNLRGTAYQLANLAMTLARTCCVSGSSLAAQTLANGGVPRPAAADLDVCGAVAT